MAALFSYSLAASLFVMLLYPVARQMVERSTDFRFNRAFLLSLLGLCALLPLTLYLTGGVSMTVNVGKSVEGMQESLFGPLDGNVGNSTPAWAVYLLPAIVIYFLGVGSLTIRETISYLRLCSIIRHSEKTDKGDYTLCHIPDRGITPFSWGKYIFFGNVKDGELPEEILLHEKSHIGYYHWIDVVFCDLICILLWYNPFVWKIRHLVKLNHEFQADSNVIASGIDPYSYQHLLLTAAMDRTVLGMANCFGSDRKGFRKRILAIGQSPSSRKGLLISLWALPALFVGFFVISTSVSDRFLREVSGVPLATFVDRSMGKGVSADAATSSNESAEFEGGEEALYDFLIRNIVYPEVPGEVDRRKHKVRVLFDVTKDGHVANIRIKNPKGEAYEEEACRVVRLTEGKWKPAVKDGKPVDSNMVLPFHFTTR